VTAARLQAGRTPADRSGDLRIPRGEGGSGARASPPTRRSDQVVPDRLRLVANEKPLYERLASPTTGIGDRHPHRVGARRVQESDQYAVGIAADVPVGECRRRIRAIPAPLRHCAPPAPVAQRRAEGQTPVRVVADFITGTAL
jgi:hypothetical protein